MHQGFKRHIKEIAASALKEDIGSGDITTNAILKTTPKSASKGSAKIIAKEDLTIAGLFIAREVFRQLDRKTVFKAFVTDGTRVKNGKCIAVIKGSITALLTGERVALNFLQHLSGIATLTHSFVSKVKGYNVKILDTRKTIPGIRGLQKYAVKCGGGCSHRFGLYDAILIKDNHIALVGGIKNAVLLAKKNAPKKKIEVEVRNFKELQEALESKVDIIMLDNMKPSQMRKAVFIISHFPLSASHFPLIEASGGINLRNVEHIAKTGVDFISIGALTHSARAVDISMKVS